MSVKALLTTDPVLMKEFFTCSYVPFFALFNPLLASDNFVTRKESLKVRCLGLGSRPAPSVWLTVGLYSLRAL